MEFDIKTMSSYCDVCGKARGIKGIHIKCSKIRQQRRKKEEAKAEKRVHA